MRAMRVALAIATASVWGSTARADAFRKGPYLQSVTPTSVTIVWEPSGAVPATVSVPTIPGRAPITVELEEIQEVVIDGLEPGRRYRFEVAIGDERASGEFATAPAGDEPFSFVVYGDSRSNPSSHRNVVERVRGEVPDFLLGTGDMVNDGGSDSDWQEFFDVEHDLLRENVLFPSLGNHDRQGRGRTADNFRKFFALPENSPDPERYYAFTYGNARFLILDSNAYSFALTDQTAWIERQLQDAQLNPRIRHIFVSMHHPPFSTALHGGQVELREAWTPLFERYNVTAVFSGHDHDYERLDHAGVRYFVSGGGGAPLYPRSRRPSTADSRASRYFERVNHYIRINVVGDHVEVTAIRVDGTIIESLAWGEVPTSPVAVSDPARDIPAAGAPSRAVPPRSGASEIAQAQPASGGGTGGFGWLGKLGAALAVAAGAAIVWSLRS